MAITDTALNIIADAAVELGLVAFGSKPTDVFGSSDPNLGQLCQLLKSVGRDLMREREWTALQSSWVFSTASNVSRYALPTDYDRTIDQTQWNRSNRLPVIPISPQAFQFMRARLVGITWNILERTLQGKFQAYPDDTTPGGYVIAYEYVSRWWVLPSGTKAATAGPWIPGVTYSANDTVASGGNLYTCTVGGKSGTTANPSGTSGAIVDGTATWAYTSAAGADTVTANGDTILFDSQMVKDALKLAWKLEKGLDASAAQGAFNDSLSKAKSADTVAPILYFNRPTFTEPLLGPWNLPINGQVSS